MKTSNIHVFVRVRNYFVWVIYQHSIIKYVNAQFLDSEFSVGAKVCRGQSVPGPKCSGAKVCRGQSVLGPKCAGAKVFWGRNVLGLKCSGAKVFWGQSVLGLN